VRKLSRRAGASRKLWVGWPWSRENTLEIECCHRCRRSNDWYWKARVGCASRAPSACGRAETRERVVVVVWTVGGGVSRHPRAWPPGLGTPGSCSPAVLVRHFLYGLSRVAPSGYPDCETRFV